MRGRARSEVCLALKPGPWDQHPCLASQCSRHSPPCGFLDDPRASVSSPSHETERKDMDRYENATMAPWPKLSVLHSIIVSPP